MEMGVPRCLYNWTWQFLRDRRATVEYQSATSGERVFRAGLPQGSVLSPALFLLWAAPLAAELQRVPGTTAFLYADDTAALCAGNDIQVARQRAQQAADTLAQWAQANKMTVAGQKTQALVLSQWPRDAANCSVKVAGETVTAGDQLKLLGVTLDRLLHFGPHCRSLRQRVRPRTAHLRKLTGREWGLQEQQLRVVAPGYVRGALEHAAAAWLPATSPTHLGLLEVEMRAAARVVTGCPRSTPAHGLMAEAGLAPVAERRTALAARLLAKARALPEDDPLRTVADREVRSRLSAVSGWRGVGEEAWREAGITPPISIEPLVHK
ncbi:putative RNA-directed DNA polymerase from transposon BS [Amphibalanus amphitrite]|uniref:Putative RNA-directed DNA polymerase from transposon BS n=1 Tax=Amphibalanus amphitrite TaxID=1232801 RepID=A0A6A4X3K3_AMPAM|nr:putative RNA-directed DNA polymerase from transposon BS [Amphibalanus amphitrite]